MRAKEGVFEGVKTRNVYHCIAKIHVSCPILHTQRLQMALYCQEQTEKTGKSANQAQRLCVKHFGVNISPRVLLA